MTDKPSEIIEKAADLLAESEVLAMEVNDPPESSFRGLWPVDAAPLVDLLRASTGLWRLYEDRGWDEKRLRSSVGSAGCAALAFAEAIVVVPGQVAAAKETENA